MTSLKTNINILKPLEDIVQQRFSDVSAYRQVKDLLEGRVEKIEGKIIIEDSRAVFSGDNRPDVLVAHGIDAIKTKINEAFSVFMEDDPSGQEAFKESFERYAAVIDNRATSKAFEVNKREAFLAGRIVMDDGVTPVSGAKVSVHAKVDDKDITISTSATDVNGEYKIKLDDDTLKKTSKKVSISIDTQKNENIATMKSVAVKSGKVNVNDVKINVSKSDIAKPLIISYEERKMAAMQENARLRQNQVEIIREKYILERTTKKMNGELDKLKSLFIKEE